MQEKYFEDHLYNVIKSRGLTFKDVGAQIGICHDTIGKHCRGDRAITGTYLPVYAKFVGIPVEQIKSTFRFMSNIDKYTENCKDGTLTTLLKYSALITGGLVIANIITGNCKFQDNNK